LEEPSVKPFVLFACLAVLATSPAHALVVNIDSTHGFSSDGGGSDPAPLPGQHIAVFLPMFLLSLPAGVLADIADRRRLIEMMWTVAYADGLVQEFEENIIWRVSELLGVPARERLAMRRKVREEHGCDPDAPGPWDAQSPVGAEGAKP
jgi:hypothetical protein